MTFESIALMVQVSGSRQASDDADVGKTKKPKCPNPVTKIPAPVTTRCTGDNTADLPDPNCVVCDKKKKNASDVLPELLEQLREEMASGIGAGT